MSADNYMLIREYEDKYVVTMEFASDDEVRPITPEIFKRGMTKIFDTFDEAYEYAASEYTEYGITYEDSENTVCPYCHRKMFDVE